jgi:hypothetical protein
MGRLFQCDWCGAIYGQRKALILMEINWVGDDERILFCPEHPPEHLINKPKDPDTGEFLDKDSGDSLPEPLITGDEAQETGIQPW